MSATNFTYQVIEDNGGGLHLAVFGTDGDCVFLASGWERDPGNLRESIPHIASGDFQNWDGGSGDPQAEYDDLTSSEYGWRIVADDNGIYPDRMGAAASIEFKVNQGA